MRPQALVDLLPIVSRSDSPDHIAPFGMRTLEHVQKRRGTLMQTDVFAFRDLVVVLRREGIAIVLAAVELSMDRRLQRRDGSRNLSDGDDALSSGRLADHIEQLAGIGFEHDHVGGRLGFESVQHV